MQLAKCRGDDFGKVADCGGGVVDLEKLGKFVRVRVAVASSVTDRQTNGRDLLEVVPRTGLHRRRLVYRVSICAHPRGISAVLNITDHEAKHERLHTPWISSATWLSDREYALI